jgi:putative ABC transport system permease protein
MKAADLFDLASRNLRESLLRNSLTTLGISVGVASLVAMLSLGVGLQQLANQRLRKSGLFDTVFVSSRRNERSFGRDRPGEAPPAERPVLDERARGEIERLPGVLEVQPDIHFATDVRYQGKEHLTSVAGLPLSAKDRDAFDNLVGRFFSSATAPEAVIQKQFAAELLGMGTHQPQSADPPVAQLNKLIGQELTLHYPKRVPMAQSLEHQMEVREGTASAAPSRSSDPDDADDAAAISAFAVAPGAAKLKIVGVTDQDPDALRGAGHARVFIPMSFAEDLHVMLPSELRDGSLSQAYASLSVRVKNPNRIDAVEDAIKKMGFSTFSILDATRSLRRFFAVLDLFLGIFGSLALAVASLGIVNTLLMATLERRREIGIMKAIGASDSDVKKLFFSEAAVMGAVGGALGVAMGWAMGKAINLGANVYLHRQNLPSENVWSVPLWLVSGAIAFAIVISIVSGLYPAARAAALDPVQTLRYE